MQQPGVVGGSHPAHGRADLAGASQPKPFWGSVLCDSPNSNTGVAGFSCREDKWKAGPTSCLGSTTQSSCAIIQVFCTEGNSQLACVELFPQGFGEQPLHSSDVWDEQGLRSSQPCPDRAGASLSTSSCPRASIPRLSHKFRLTLSSLRSSVCSRRDSGAETPCPRQPCSYTN